MGEGRDADRVVVGVDGSTSSIHALRYAARIAEAFDAPLEAVMSSFTPTAVQGGFPVAWSPQQVATDILDHAVQQAFGSSPPRELKRTVISGPPAWSLIEMSDSCGMIVLGSRGHGGFVGLLLGSVSATCAEHAHCPVLVVHEPANSATSHAGPGGA